MPLKAYIIFGLNYNIKLIIGFIVMIGPYLYSQQSLDPYGFIGNPLNSSFRNNSIESNVVNYSTIEDWELSLILKNRLRGSSNINLSNASIGKRFGDNYFYFRYTPGYMQEFVFNSRTEFLLGDTVQNYRTNLSYSEKYGLGYSASISDDFTIGFSLRYFQQSFREEYPTFFIDTVNNTNLIQIREETVNKNFWRGDIGIHYQIQENLRMGISSINLFILKDFDEENNESEFDIKKDVYNYEEDKELNVHLEYEHDLWAMKAEYETSNSFALGINRAFSLGSSSLSFGIKVFHDAYQDPFIAGFIPVVNYSTNLLSLSLSYNKYLSDRSEIRSLNQLKEYGIRNINNNYFSSDNINLMLNFALSFKDTKSAKFIDLIIIKEIFPTFNEIYSDEPIAYAKVENISDENIMVKPSILMKNVNSEEIHSPMVDIAPYDTVLVPFFIVFEENKTQIVKTKLSPADFFIYTTDAEPDDQIQKTLLLHSANSWDGKVKNLRFFVRNDFDYSSEYSKNVLNKINNDLPTQLHIFSQVRQLYNHFIRGMNYIADRRASVDYVQFPKQTVQLKGGDCDDLSVAFSSLLEGIGIQTAFIDYKPKGDQGHVALMVNTKLSPSESEQITINDRKFFARRNTSGREEIWIPLETTIMTSFDDAWNVGAARFYEEGIEKFGLQRSFVNIVDVF